MGGLLILRDFAGGSMSVQKEYPPVGVVAAALRGRCPRCGHGRLYKGFVGLHPACDACGLSYAFADSGDGPAVFMSLIAGAIVIGMLLWVDATYAPPMWLEMAIFLPLTIVVCLGALRPFKALLIGLQYRNKAGQGRLTP